MKDFHGVYDLTGEKEPFYFRAAELKVLSQIRKGDVVRSSFWTKKNEQSVRKEPAEIMNATSTVLGLRFLADGVEALVPRVFAEGSVMEFPKEERERLVDEREKRELGWDEL